MVSSKFTITVFHTVGSELVFCLLRVLQEYCTTVEQYCWIRGCTFSKNGSDECVPAMANVHFSDESLQNGSWNLNGESIHQLFV